METATHHVQLALKTDVTGVGLPGMSWPTKQDRPPTAAGGRAVEQAVVAGEGVTMGVGGSCDELAHVLPCGPPLQRDVLQKRTPM